MIQKMCSILGFDEVSTKAFVDTYEKIKANPEALSLFESTQEKMFAGDLSFKEDLPKISEISGVYRYATDMVFWLRAALPLREMYKKEGIADSVWLNSMQDLPVKNNECIKIYGVPGIFTEWVYIFYSLKGFGMGRLEYDIREWELDDYSPHLKKGDHVFACHIPSRGPLLPNEVKDSFKMLYAFAKERNLLNDGILAIGCATWLLYTPMIDLLPETSNLKKFHNLFDIIELRDRPGCYSENFRIFYKHYDGNPESLKDLPEDTSLQRILKKHYIEGGHQGIGRGVILFDGEEIINK